MKMSIKKRLSLYILGIVFVTTLVVVLVILPNSRYILGLKSDIGYIQEELETRYEKTQKLRKSLRELETIKAEVEKFADITVKENEELRLITELENIASSHNIEQNLDLAYIDTSEQTEKAKGKEKEKSILPRYYKFSFLNNGFFEDHLDYLKSLESLPYYIMIDELRFEKRKGGEDLEKNEITLRFEGKIYVETN